MYGCRQGSSPDWAKFYLVFGLKHTDGNFYYGGTINSQTLAAGHYSGADVNIPSFEVSKAALGAMGFDSSTGSDLTFACSNLQFENSVSDLTGAGGIAIPTTITSTIKLTKTGSSICPATATTPTSSNSSNSSNNSSRSTLQALVPFSSLALVLMAFSFN